MGIVSTALKLFFNILMVLVTVRVLTSWFRPRYRNRSNGWFFTIDEYVWRATEPFLAPIRNILPTGGMGIDLSPWLLLLILRMVSGFLIDAVQRMGL